MAALNSLRRSVPHFTACETLSNCANLSGNRAGHAPWRAAASASKIAHTQRAVKLLARSLSSMSDTPTRVPLHPMRTSISRFLRLSCSAFLVFAVFAISAPAVMHPAQSQSSQPSQSQDQKADQDQTPAAQSGKNVPDKPPVDPKSKKDKKSDEPPESKLHITVVSAENNKPVGSASVYIRYPEGKTFFTRKEKDAEENFKTNQDGSVKVPSVPRGKILIQVIAPGWHTYGKWYDIDKDEVEIQIKLEKPPHWY